MNFGIFAVGLQLSLLGWGATIDHTFPSRLQNATFLVRSQNYLFHSMHALPTDLRDHFPQIIHFEIYVCIGV
jgi:hypothetical protein